MNRQNMFDQVAEHLLTQKVKAEDVNGDCLYLDPATGYRCGIGCLIPDDHIALHSRSDVQDLIETYHDLAELWQVDMRDFDDMGFLNKLQSIHDSCAPESWKVRFEHFAYDYGLNKKILTDFC